MGIHNIKQPQNTTVSDGTMNVTIKWDASFSGRMSAIMDRKQQIVDSEVLRYCSPLVPLRTGALRNSGTIGTVIGSGQVKYVTPYARFQYYATAETRDYDPRRGGKWFERMKSAHKDDILRAAESG